MLCVVTLAAGQNPHPLAITHGPVVEGVGNTWAVIAWTTNTGGSTVLRYGTSPTTLNQTAEAPWAKSKSGEHVTHRVHLKDLKPNTTYYFVVDSGQGQGTGTESRSQVAQFTTK
ncbi:MAG: fibronectin type III domain-containing protein [Terriglobales bacterium]